MNKLALITLTLVLAAYSGMATASDIEIKDWEKEVFAKLDTDNNDFIDTAEMRAMTKTWMDNLGWDEAKQVKRTNMKFKRYDSNKDKKVSLEEHVIGNRKEKERKKQKKMKQNN